VSETLELKFPSRIESVDEAATKVCEFATELGLSNELLFPIDLAVRESVANAIKHGNKFDETKDVDIRLVNSNEEFEITVKDHGHGFNLEEIPDPTDPANLLKTNGRGILFMRSFMDIVDWSNGPDGGLIVRMVKKH
jgi:serine/threonine-protein kinase RsbW